MQSGRIFSAEKYKGTKNYLDTQRWYALLRTVLYFGTSISLFIAGFLTTGTRVNMLTVVAVLGCLPASKSAVNCFMHFRYRSLTEEVVETINGAAAGLNGLFDMVFTSYEKNYLVGHIVVKGNTICGYTEDKKFDEQGFYKHIDGILKADQLTNTTVKIYSDLLKYTDRLKQLAELETDEANTIKILEIFKNISI